MGIFDFFKKSRSNARNNHSSGTTPNTDNSPESVGLSIPDRLSMTWEKFDVSYIKDILSDDFVYRSMGVVDKLDRSAYLDYLPKKFETFKRNSISYKAEPCTLDDGQECIRLIDQAHGQESFLAYRYDGAKITSLLMRPKVVFTLKDLENRDKGIEIINQTIVPAIVRYVDGLIPSLGIKKNDLEWLQTYPFFNAPTFQHMCFRLRSSVMSIRLEICDIYGNAVNLPNAKIENQIKICKANNLIPCTLIIDVNGLFDPTIVLSDFLTGQGDVKDVDLKEIANNGTGLMGNWEISHYAIMGVIDFLEKNSCRIISYTDDPTAFPQISFLKDDKPCYVNVYSHPSGIDQPEPLDVSQINVLNQQGWQGYYADVSVTYLLGNNGNFNDVKIYRNGSAVYHIKDVDTYPLLMPIEEAMNKYGVKS